MYVPTYGSTALVGLGLFFSFLIYTQSVGLLGWGISPSRGHYLHTEQNKQKKRAQTLMTGVGFDTAVQVFERAKRGHALDRVATVVGSC
jgi:hypothetical protein